MADVVKEDEDNTSKSRLRRVLHQNGTEHMVSREKMGERDFSRIYKMTGLRKLVIRNTNIESSLCHKHLLDLRSLHDLRYRECWIQMVFTS